MARQFSERGDTLVEVLLALIILSVAGVALLAGFATAISSSAEHRNLASQDSSERTAANAAIADIQQQAGQSNDPFSCPNGQPDGFTPSFSNLTGHFQVTITSVNYWNGSGWQSGCVAGAAQQYTLTISNASAGWSTTETTVISDPGAPASPTKIGTASQLAWVQQPTTGSAYAPMSPQPEVAVEDSSGNIVTSDFSSVTLQVVSGPTGGTISSTCSGVESYGLVQFSDCSLSNAGTYQIQAVDSGTGFSSTPATVTVTPATAAKIAFTSNSLTGAASNSPTVGAITVQEQDAFGDAFPTTTPVTVALSSNSTGTNEFAAGSNGTPIITSVTIPAGSSSASFYYGDTKAGTPTLTATASGLVPGTQSETITPTTATKLVITSNPLSAASGTAATAPFTVTLEDTFGNATTKTGATTVSLTSTSTGAKFATTSNGSSVTSVNLPANTSSVTAYYADSKVGTPTITAAASGLASGTQQESITSGPTKLVLTGPASGSASATASLGPFTVTEETASGTLTTVGETVNLTSNSAGTYLFNTTQGSTGPTGATSVTIPSGQSSATFYYGDTHAATPTITASVSGLTSGTQQETITSGPVAQLNFTTGTVSGTASSSAKVGPLTVQEQDAFGNATTTALTVNLSSTSAGPYEFAATSGGAAITSVNIAAGNSTASFYYGDENSGTPVLTAAATGLTSDTQFVTINAGTGTQLAISSTAFTGTANASATNALAVTLEDTYGNPTTKTGATTVNLTSTSTGTHEFSATSGGTAATSVTLPANTSSVTAYYGDESPGPPTLTAAATGLASATQQETINGRRADPS